jgi:multiple sugar transport system permease protein
MQGNTARIRRRRRQETFLPYLLLVPAFVLLVGMVYPFGLGLYYSFTSYWLQYPNRFRFVWFDNYVGLLSEPLFVRALEFTLGFTLVAVVVQVGLGLAVALFLHARIPGRGAIRALMLLPLMMPPVITALMWNYLLSFLDVGPVNWFGSTQGAIVSILIIDTWGNLPFVSLILLGALQALPTEPYEAARVDGASPAAILRYLTLPLLGAIQFISYEQVLWGQMAAATIVSALPQLLLSLMVQKYIVRGLTMGAVR